MTRLKTPAACAAPARSLLLIDAGNTRIKWMWITGGAGAEPVLPKEPGGTLWQHVGIRAHDRLAKLAEDWRDCHASGVVSPEVWISAVADLALRDVFTARIARVPDGAHVCIVASEGATVGLCNGYRDPAQPGTDQWIGAVGARHLWPDTALLLVTVDTATMLDIVTPDGLFIGNLILPGLILMIRALSRNTAQLSEVDVGYLSTGDVVASPWINNTQDAITLGCVIAQVGAITQTWQAPQKQYPGLACCVLSGGARAVLGPYLRMPFQMHDSLVLLDLQALVRARREGAAMPA